MRLLIFSASGFLRPLLWGVVCGLGCAASVPGAAAVSAEAALRNLSHGNVEIRKRAIRQLARSGDPRLIQLLEDYRTGSLFVWEGRVVLVLETTENDDFEEVAHILDFLTRQPLAGKQAGILLEDLEELSPSPQEYQTIREAKTLVELSDRDPGKRKEAVVRMGDAGKYESAALLAEVLAGETDKKVRQAIQESLYLIQVKNSGRVNIATLLTAVDGLNTMHSERALAGLQGLAERVSDADVRQAAAVAVKDIEGWQSMIRGISHVFSGLSLGSILVIMALGLSIIFGLMGVINMAHGELMMIGAYTGYVMQLAFERWMPPEAFNWYFVCAMPMSFLTAALVGLLIEVAVIRHLYGRPLETLLATWGISLILIQAVRLQYGDNIAVNNPTWLRGGFEVIPGVILAYNRCFIIALCAFCVVLTYAAMGRTKIGLLIRATTQLRDTASSLGVNTRRMDAYTFAFGAGLAGIAGCALTLIGGVTPDMGQNYIVDSFLVVVTGGVGKLAGVVWGGLGLGCINKFLEPFFAAVWAKVLVLVLVVLFIQWKPSGLFPTKGRLANV